MTGVTVRIERSQLDRLLADGSKLAPLLDQASRRSMVAISNEITMSLHGDPLRGRSGQLAKSWRLGAKGNEVQGGASLKVEATDSGVAASLGSDAPQARILEEGGTVSARNRKYLAIPLAPAKTSAGVVKRGAESPNMVEGLFPIRSRAGNLLLVKAIGKGKRARLEPWYLLRESVEIRAFGYLTQAVRRAEEQLPAIWEALVAQRLGGEAS